MLLLLLLTSSQEKIKLFITNALRALVNNPFKKSFYEKRKKKTINVLTVFFTSHKSGIKTFLKWIID